MFRRSILLAAALVAALLLCAPPCLRAQTTESDQRPSGEQRLFSQMAADWLARLDRLTLSIARPGMTSAEARNYREDLGKLRDAALAQKQINDTQVQSVRALLDVLGPPPAADAAPEPAGVATQRKDLGDQLATFEGRGRQAELCVRRADNLMAQLSSAEHTAFAERLMQVGPVPLLPSVLWDAAIDLRDALASGLRQAVEQLHAMRQDGRWVRGIVALAVVSLVGWLTAGPLRRGIVRYFGRDPAIAAPSYARRLTAAMAEGIAVGLLPALLLLAVLWHANTRGVLSGRALEIVTGAGLAGACTLLAAAIITAALAPHAPAWRLIHIDDAQARALSRRLLLLVALFALDIALDLMASTLGVAEALGAVYGFISNTAIALMLFAVTQPRLWRPAPRGAEPGDGAAVEGEPDQAPQLTAANALRWLRFRLVASALMLMVPVSALAGYGAFADFLVTGLVWTALLLVTYIALRALARDVMTLALDAGTAPGNWARQALLLDDSQAERLRAWMQILVDATCGFVGIVILVTIWGVNLDDLLTWLRRILTGVNIGRYTIAPGNVLVGVVVFFLMLLATRLVQRFLSERVMPQTRLDRGAQDSIRAAVGYLGFTVALLVGVSAMGIDLSSVALVAGALGVGIGFGLQTIVNNFVSGLIMLAERPVKVGDVIRVGDQTGQVRAINVRATEVDTGEGATVIVPNSVIISAPVINLTHKNGTSRVDIKLGVVYGSNVTKVGEVLMACARANKLVLSLPQPTVVFANFGASSLEFELRVFVAELAHIVPAGNELRLAIDKAFGEQGIEFAYNRMDVMLVNPPAALPGRA
ncbi:MAG: mechanosensitive ion channel family protein [Alphaproteobacteria bacterium]|nr:mechanosensitive ion channel family protein [Alphaproteobacteria bacterium]